MEFIPDNLPALAFAIIVLPVALLITKFILWPILNNTIIPFSIILIKGGIKFINLFLF